jgi:hypothetical protein
MAKKKSKELSPINQIRLIRKSNKLVEARYKFDIWETRVFVKMLTMIQADDQDFYEYRIDINEIIKDFGLHPTGPVYQTIRESAKKLLTKVITLERDTAQGIMEFVSPLIAGVDSFKTNHAENYIMVSFHPKMKPYLLELRDRYLVYDVKNIVKLTSVYSIRIYELLKQYEKIGTRNFTIDELKTILGISPDEYQLYGHFKDKVILKAQRDLASETDIEFSYQEIKDGRRVVQLVFQIQRNTHLPLPAALAGAPLGTANQGDAAQADPVANEVEALFAQVGAYVSRVTLAEWLAAYPLAQVQAAARYTLDQLAQGARIRSVGAYLAKMVKASPPVHPPSPAPRLRAKAQPPLPSPAEAAQERLNQLKKERHEQAWKIVELLLASEPGLPQLLCDDIAGTLFGAYYKPDHSFAENLQSAMFRAYVLDGVQRRFPGQFAPLASYDQQIAQLETAAHR